MASQQAGGRRVNADEEMVAVVYLSSSNGIVGEYNNDVKSSLEKTDVKISLEKAKSSSPIRQLSFPPCQDVTRITWYLPTRELIVFFVQTYESYGNSSTTHPPEDAEIESDLMKVSTYFVNQF